MKDLKIYHLYPRGVRRGNLFETAAQHERFRDLVGKYAKELGVQILVLVDLTNHYHGIILCLPEIRPIFCQKLNWAYATSFNREKDFSGHAFESSAAYREIFGDADLAYTALYDFLNPTVAGMSVSPIDYPWSTYAPTVGLTASPSWLNPDKLLNCFSPDLQTARELLRKEVEWLTPHHPVMREASRQWESGHPRSSKAKNCLRAVEFAAMMKVLVESRCPSIQLEQGTTLEGDDLQLLALSQLTPASEYMMSLLMEMPRSSVHKCLIRAQKIIQAKPEYQSKVEAALRRLHLRI